MWILVVVVDGVEGINDVRAGENRVVPRQYNISWYDNNNNNNDNNSNSSSSNSNPDKTWQK